jgi:hypothetical protein
LPSAIVTSSLTSVGTIGTGVWNGTAIGIAYGGTGQTTASAGFNALSPITTTGDLILGNGTNSATRLPIGTNGYVLTVSGGTAVWSASGSGSGTVNSGTANQLTYYASTGTAVSGASPLTYNSSTATPILTITKSTPATFSGLNFVYSTATSSILVNDGTGEMQYAAGTGSSGYFQTFKNNGTEAMRITSAGDVGIGTTTPDIFGNSFARSVGVAVTGTGATASLNISGGSGGASRLQLGVGSTRYGVWYQDASNFMQIGTFTSLPISFITNSTEGMRLDASGNLLVGTTTSGGWQGNARGEFYSTGAGGFSGAGGVALSVYQSGNSVVAQNIRVNATSTAFIQFQYNGATTVGSITTNGSSTTYATSSDYRLKNTIAPMTGALAKVAQLNPVTYKWNADGSDSQGFIAHELQEVVPECVTGSKDEVDADGNPKYQGIDTSFLVATLTSALQELNTLITAQSATITSLTERITALENK